MRRQTAPVGYLIEPLGKQHDRDSFDCGVEPLNRYLKQQAGRDQKRHVAIAFVLVEEESRRIAGYYTLSATSIELEALPAGLRRRLPRYPSVPATLLGRLAVDRSYRGRRFGGALLADALRRSWLASREIASFAVIVDAKDEVACAFYERFGFVAFESEPFRRILPMQTIADLA